MKILNEQIYNKSKSTLKSLYGENARFRNGQYEAIEATLLNKRTLIVQKTGWGKSLVYFMCTKILRGNNKGVTIVVSPLLVLMQNQLEAAEKLKLKCDVLNSKAKDRRDEILEQLKTNKLDLILVTPETLFKDEIQNILKDIEIGLFVIDEAHCISDWGHDFRLEYGNLHKVISILPSNVPILATTATANNRVIEDLTNQLGKDVYISRGPLTRKSLAIQVLNFTDKAQRYAWILQNINNIPGSGIIYCLTQRDCDYLADFLYKNGIYAASYHSGKSNKETTMAEQLFKNNEIKAIVATIKLGMGYDKGDIGFVIHFQMPSNIVSYYQQIGRAGRNIKKAYIFLMHGQEDNDINNYFIKTAFPSETDTNQIIKLLEEINGLSLYQIIAHLNIRRNIIKKALTFLLNDGFVMKDRGKHYLTTKQYYYDKKHYSSVTSTRIHECEQMIELTETKKCYSKFIANCLDDTTAIECGNCSNCMNIDILESTIDNTAIESAQEYINSLIMPINPRLKWAQTSITKMTNIPYINDEGICLSKYGDIGYGELVKQNKYSKEKRFCDELVGKSTKILKPIIAEKKIDSITYVPSLRCDIVKDFAKRLASSCGIDFVQSLLKKDAQPQKSMENSSHQCENALNSFYIEENAAIPKRTILIDDIVDSRWTLTVCGYILMENGCEKVIPFALADSSQKET